MAGAIFAIGLVVFCRNLPRPWLALAVAVPYLVIVVAMGYSRQGVALGLAMLGLVALGKKGTGWFVFWVLSGGDVSQDGRAAAAAGGTCRGAKSLRRNSLGSRVAGLGLLAVPRRFRGKSLCQLRRGGISVVRGDDPSGDESGAGGGACSSGARNSHSPRAERRLWLLFALISLALFGVFLVSPASTAVDRIALYMLPLQLVVFAHASRCA